MKIATQSIEEMSDDEIVLMIQYGHEVLKDRFETRKRSLESQYEKQIKAAIGKPKRTRKEKRDALSQAA